MKQRYALLLCVFLLTACGHGGGSGDGGFGPSDASITLVNNRALLSWSAGTGLADGYVIEQSTDAVHWTQIQTVTETSAYIDGLSTGTTYYFRLKSFNSAGNSAYTGSVSVSL